MLAMTAVPRHSMASGADFVQSLPYDVIARILSFLSQQDCIRCTEVCQSWNALVPVYARETVGRQIRLSGRHGLGSAPKFLGPHVNAVSLTKCARLDRLLDMLYAEQCSNIQRFDLGGAGGGRMLHPSLWVDRLPLFPGLRELRLLDIDLAGCDGYDLAAQLVASCPVLSCLWITQSSYLPAANPPRIAPPCPPASSQNRSSSSSMEFLCLRLDCYGIQVRKLQPVLRLCPNLTRLSARSFDCLDASVLDLCPRLQYLEWNPHTDQYLHWPAPRPQQPPARLQHLVTVDTSLPAISCCSEIRSLTVVEMSADNGTTTARFLGQCQRIAELAFDPLESIDIPRHTLPTLPRLAQLELTVLDPDTADGLVHFFENYHAPSSNLQVLALQLPIPRSLARVLKAMVSVTTLKRLGLRPACVSDEELRNYVAHAPQHLEHLDIVYGPALSLETFNMMGSRLERLTLLSVSSYGSDPVSGAGIRALVDKICSRNDTTMDTPFSFAITCNSLDDDSCIAYAKQRLGNRFSFTDFNK